MSSTVLELMDELLFFTDDIYLLYIEKVFIDFIVLFVNLFSFEFSFCCIIISICSLMHFFQQDFCFHSHKTKYFIT